LHFFRIFSPYLTGRHGHLIFFTAEARAEILGAPDLYIMSGSSLRLVCRLQGSTQAPLFVFWYHSDRMINFDTDRGLIVHINSTESDLIMPYTNTSDSGNYTCQPQNIPPATIHVHVLQCKYISRTFAYVLPLSSTLHRLSYTPTFVTSHDSTFPNLNGSKAVCIQSHAVERLSVHIHLQMLRTES
jgi:hypothetical protein